VAYVSPRDFLQDVVSAREFLAGRSMYPEAMNERFADLIAEERRYRAISLGEALDRKRDQSLANTVAEHWVQAHPPFLSVFFAAMVRPFGVLGTQVALAVLTFVCLAFACGVLARELGPSGDRWKTLALAAAACGSAPVVATLRNGQADAILLALIVLAWDGLRRGRRDGPGLAIGLAVSLKLIPGLLLPVLLVRWPRAFLAAVLTLLATGAIVAAGAGWEAFPEYRRTAEGVVAEYASYPSNISVLGFPTRALRLVGAGPDLARVIWIGLGCTLGLSLLVVSRRRTDDRQDADLLLATVTALIPLLSPVAWDHYLTFLLFPLAVAAARGISQLLLALMLIPLAIPETAYHAAVDKCRAAGWRELEVFLVEPARTYAAAALAICLGRRALRRGPPYPSEPPA
jgi:hypothetical protein